MPGIFDRSTKQLGMPRARIVSEGLPSCMHQGVPSAVTDRGYVLCHCTAWCKQLAWRPLPARIEGGVKA